LVLPRLGTSARASRATACSLAETHSLDEWQVSVFCRLFSEEHCGTFCGTLDPAKSRNAGLDHLTFASEVGLDFGDPGRNRTCDLQLEDRRSKWQLR